MKQPPKNSLKNIIPKSEQAITRANTLFRIHCDDVEIWETMESYLYNIRKQATLELIAEFTKLSKQVTQKQ